MSKLRIVVGGLIGLLPAGGVTWDYVQYPLGLAELGHDIYYIEDTHQWPVYQYHDGQVSASTNVKYLASVMEAFGLSERWSYRDEITGEYFGLPQERVLEICRTADVFINVSCATYLTDEYRQIPVRAFIDSDPMFTQLQCLSKRPLNGEASSQMERLLSEHTHHFSFGEHIGAPDCRIPDCGIVWRPTRQPICLAYWPVLPVPTADDARVTTVMNWSAAAPMHHEGESWGQKDIEFLRFIDLPRHVPELRLALAISQTTGMTFPASEISGNGWTILDPAVCAGDWRQYRSFIQRSLGEFSVAKETYVKSRSGWFSCRSACYLASGRPVITQDTAWTRHLPHGEGLLPFDDMSSAVSALEAIAAAPQRHARAAREIAEDCFSSNAVLGDLLGQVGA
ncbi:MAG: glycosyltransferase [Dehalococcoidia bacterium]